MRSKKLVRNMQTPPPSWLSWFGSKAPEKNAAADDDDDDYQIRKLKAQVSVLREDLELQLKRTPGSNADLFSSLFKLSNDTGSWSISSNAGSLCRDANTSTILHISIVNNGLAIAAALQPVCPHHGQSTTLAFSNSLLQAAALETGETTLCATVRVEALNVPLDDVWRSFPPKSKGSDNLHGCRRLSFTGVLSQPPLEPGCLNLTVAGGASLRSDCPAATTLSAAKAAAAHRDLLPPPLRPSPQKWIGRPSGDRAAAVLMAHQKCSRFAHTTRQGHRPRWLRVIGDSVTYSLRQMIQDAFFERHATSSNGLLKGVSVRSKAGPEKSSVARSTNSRYWTTWEAWYDNGCDTHLGCGDVALIPSIKMSLPEQFHANLSAAGPPLIVLSLGAHASNLGSDDGRLEERYRKMLSTFWKAQPPGSELILLNEAARGMGVPSRFSSAGGACMATNLRCQERGIAAEAALRSVCPDQERCRVVDLFSATLPHIFDKMVYNQGDSIHFKLKGGGPFLSASWRKAAGCRFLERQLKEILCEAMRTCHAATARVPFVG